MANNYNYVKVNRDEVLTIKPGSDHAPFAAIPFKIQCRKLEIFDDSGNYYDHLGIFVRQEGTTIDFGEKNVTVDGRLALLQQKNTNRNMRMYDHRGVNVNGLGKVMTKLPFIPEDPENYEWEHVTLSDGKYRIAPFDPWWEGQFIDTRSGERFDSQTVITYEGKIGNSLCDPMSAVILSTRIHCLDKVEEGAEGASFDSETDENDEGFYGIKGNCWHPIEKLSHIKGGCWVVVTKSGMNSTANTPICAFWTSSTKKLKNGGVEIDHTQFSRFMVLERTIND